MIPPLARSARADRLWALAAVLPFVAISLWYWDYIPIWDAREYADCIAGAARKGHFPRDYVCAGHPTLVYALFSSALVSLLPAPQVAILIVHVAFGVVTLLSFRALGRGLFPGHDRELTLLTGVLGVFPILLGATVSVSPDCAVAAFFLAFLACLARGRFWSAALCGLLLVFSKETGCLLLVMAVGLHALIFVTRGAGTLADKERALKAYLPTLLPLLAFAGWIAWSRRAGTAAFWGNRSSGSLLELFTSFSLLEKQFVGHLMAICVFQFLWLVTGAAAVRWISKLKGALLGLPSKDPTSLRWLDAMFFAALFLLTRYRAYVNLRYYLALFPLLLLCGYAAIAGLPRLVRVIAIGALGVLFAVSSFRTVDPVARFVVGTFDLGKRPLLMMTQLGDDCCGYGRDQLVYNLEHTEFHYLQDELYPTLRPSAERPLAGPLDADYLFIGRLDRQSWRRTMRQDGTVSPRLLMMSDFKAGNRPAELSWMRLPNFDLAEQEKQLLEWYQPQGRQTFTHGAYALEVVTYRLR